jgi:hypothetical protein
VKITVCLWLDVGLRSIWRVFQYSINYFPVNYWCVQWWRSRRSKREIIGDFLLQELRTREVLPKSSRLSALSACRLNSLQSVPILNWDKMGYGLGLVIYTSAGPSLYGINVEGASFMYIRLTPPLKHTMMHVGNGFFAIGVRCLCRPVSLK